MPFANNTMVEVINDRVPWYGQVVSYAHGLYTVRVGGSDMTVDVMAQYVRLHPTARLMQRPEQGQVDALLRGRSSSRTNLGILPNGVDYYGSTAANRLPAILAENSDRGTIVTVANVHALLLLMSSSQSHVIIADINAAHMQEIETLIGLAGRSETMLDWYTLVYESFGLAGKKLINMFVNKHRPRHANLLALQQCRPRLHYVRADLAEEGGTNGIIETARKCGCDRIGIIYVSNIEHYLSGTNLERFRSNILGLMQSRTILIRSKSIKMSVHVGAAAATEWTLSAAASDAT